MSPPPAYRLVGYATMPDTRRLRVYIDADAPVTSLMDVMVQAAPGRFDYCGEPLGLRPAPDDLAGSVRSYLLRQPSEVDSQQGTSFQAAIAALG
jgi:hypothetical protein